jgi:hypothetical protein
VGVVVAQVGDELAVEAEDWPQFLGRSVGLEFDLAELGQQNLVLESAGKQVGGQLPQLSQFLSEGDGCSAHGDYIMASHNQYRLEE